MTGLPSLIPGFTFNFIQKKVYLFNDMASYRHQKRASMTGAIKHLGLCVEDDVKNSNEEVEIRFRFVRLNKLQAYTLKRDITDSTYQQHDKEDCFVGCVLLTESNIDQINDFYVRQRVDISECDIVVSVVTDSNSVDVPVIVNRMLKYIDCTLIFSFKTV
jgi:hypothetical protein